MWSPGMSGNGILLLVLLAGLWGCGGPRSPLMKQVEKVERHSQKGAEWLNQGEREQAAREFERALNLSRGMDYQPGVARELNHLGAVALEKQDFQQARELFRRALEVNLSLGNSLEASTNLANLATVAELEGDELTAAYYLTEAENHARRSKDKDALARIYARWADFFRQKGDLGRAEVYLDMARPLARAPAVKAQVAHQEGRLALARGNPQAASRHLLAALEWDRELQDRAAMAADLFQLGEASRMLKDWERAFDYYARAFAVYSFLKRQNRLQECLERLREANREGGLNRSLEPFKVPGSPKG